MEKIENKIRKLLALGERAGTEAEANAAMNAAHRLLAEYNLDMDSILASSGEKMEAIITDDSTPSNLRNTAWVDSIWGAISRLYFCEAFFRTKHATKERFYCVMGKPSNIAIVKYIAQYLVNTCEELAIDEGREAAQEMADEGVTLNIRAWRGSFKVGFSNRICIRAREAIEAAKAGKIEGSNGRALVLTPLYDKEKQAVELYKKEQGMKLKYSRRSMSVRSTSGFQAGSNAAQNVNISGNGIGGKPSSAGYLN